MILDFGHYKNVQAFHSRGFVLFCYIPFFQFNLMAPINSTPVDPNAPLKKKPVSYKNLALGACKS